MKKLILLLTMLLPLFIVEVEAQVNSADAIGSALQFLTTNPSTANRMNSGEQVALNLVGRLFTKIGDRKHDLNVASQGQDQININYDSGTASLVRDQSGKVYLLLNNTIYPISQDFIDQAIKGGVLSTPNIRSYLPGYDLPKMKRNFNKRKTNMFFFTYFHDDNKDGINNFEEFHGKNRNFEKGTLKVFVRHIVRSRKHKVVWTIEAVDSYGKVIFTRSKETRGNFGAIFIVFNTFLAVPGDYIINANVMEFNKKGKKIYSYNCQDSARIF